MQKFWRDGTQECHQHPLQRCLSLNSWKFSSRGLDVEELVDLLDHEVPDLVDGDDFSRPLLQMDEHLVKDPSDPGVKGIKDSLKVKLLEYELLVETFVEIADGREYTEQALGG